MKNNNYNTVILLIFTSLSLILFCFSPIVKSDSILNKIELLIQKGELQEALVILERPDYLRSHKELLSIFLTICIKLGQQKSFFNGLKEYHSEIVDDKELTSRITDFLITTSLKLCASEQNIQNLKFLVQAKEFLPENTYLSLLSKHQIQTNKIYEALKTLDKLEKNAINSNQRKVLADIYHEKYRIYFEHLLDYPKARNFAQMGYHEDPENINCVYSYAKISSSTTSISIIKGYLKTHVNQGLQTLLIQKYTNIGDYKNSLLETNRAIKLFPKEQSFQSRLEYISSLNKTLLPQKVTFSIKVINVPQYHKGYFYLYLNSDHYGNLNDTITTRPIKIRKERKYNFKLNLPKEGSHCFSLFSDRKMTKLLTQGIIHFFRKDQNFTIDYETLISKTVNDSLHLAKPKQFPQKNRLFIFILDGISMNIIKPLLLNGQMPFFNHIWNSGFSSIFYSPYPTTNIALHLMSTIMNRKVVYSDYLMSIANEWKQTSLWPTIPIIDQIMQNYNKNTRMKTLSGYLKKTDDIDSLNLIYHNYSFPLRDYNPKDTKNNQEQLFYSKNKKDLLFKFKKVTQLMADNNSQLVIFYENETDYILHNYLSRYKNSFPPLNNRVQGYDFFPKICQLIDGEIYKFYQKYIHENDTLIITSDHGFLNDYQHGHNGLFMAIGPGLKPSKKEQTINQYDFSQMVINFFMKDNRVLQPILDNSINTCNHQNTKKVATGTHLYEQPVAKTQ